MIPDGNEGPDTAHRRCAAASKLAEDYPVAVGLPRNAWLIRELGTELISLKAISKERGELEGDPVARREIHARISALSAELEELLRSAFLDADWYIAGQHRDASAGQNLTRMVSDLADSTFPDTPIVRSELVNRDKPSSNSQAGIRQLLHAMVKSPQAEDLDILGYPAERGIYGTVLERTGLHRETSDGTYAFVAPDSSDEVNQSFAAMWQAAETLINNSEDAIGLDELYRLWNAPPFGVKTGLLSIITMAFIQANRSSIVLYVDGRFEPNLNDFVTDRILQDEAAVSLKRFSMDDGTQDVIQELQRFVNTSLGQQVDADGLAIARALVRFVLTLPEWSRRTSNLSKAARQVRDSLIRAHDPNQTLAVDLPLAVEGAGNGSPGRRISKALSELADAYPAMLTSLRNKMFKALGHHSGGFKALHKRAETVKDLTGDLRLNAFATRLVDLTDDQDAMEAIASLALNKPPRDWSDRDPDQAAIALAKLALQFRQAEAFAGVKGRSPTQTAMAVVIGTGETGRTLMDSFNVPTSDEKDVADLSDAILQLLRDRNLSREALLAALARSGAALIEEGDPKKVAIAS